MTVFGRRRRTPGRHTYAHHTDPADGGGSWGAGPGDPADPPGEPVSGEERAGSAPVPAGRPRGPWDVSEPAPALDRVDLGGMRIPVPEGVEIQVNVLEQEIVAATVAHRAGTLQLQAFAAPKSEGLWDEARDEIATELTGLGSDASRVDGPFGVELRTVVQVPTPRGTTDAQPARFVGVDGPRWLLRGVFTGPGGTDPHQAVQLEEVFRGVVVVRGDAPLPPRERLALRMPDDQQPRTQDAPAAAGGPAVAGAGVAQSGGRR